MLSKLFTDYYKAQQLSPTAANRFDVTHIFGAYPPFADRLLNKTKFNVGGLSFYYGKYTYSKAKKERVPQMSISRGSHISGVYVPSVENNLLAYGDVKDTQDAIILVFSEDYKTIEIFVARGKLNDSQNIYNEVKAGHYNDENEALQAEAKEVFKMP